MMIAAGRATTTGERFAFEMQQHASNVFTGALSFIPIVHNC